MASALSSVVEPGRADHAARRASHGHTSASGRPCHPGLGLPRPIKRDAGCHEVRLPPCRITNESSELEHMRDREKEKADAEWMHLGRNYQIPNPELGPLEQRVGRQYVEALFSDDISLEDTDYWFTEPPGGWDSSERIIRRLPETETVVDHNAYTPGPGRTPLRELKEGMEVTGEIERMTFYHGIHVDIGADFSALIPMYADDDDWAMLHKRGVTITTPIRARIHTIFPGAACRYPIVLELLEPANVIELTRPPGAYKPSFDLRGVGDMDTMRLVTGMDPGYGRPYDADHIPAEELEAADEDMFSPAAVEDFNLARLRYGLREGHEVFFADEVAEVDNFVACL